MDWHKHLEFGMKGWTTFIREGILYGKGWHNFFIKKSNNNLRIMRIYVDDIIFGATNYYLCEEFSKLMKSKFEMSMI